MRFKIVASGLLKPHGSRGAGGGTEVPPFRRQAVCRSGVTARPSDDVRHLQRNQNPSVPERTLTKELLALVADEAGDGVHEIELGEDFEFCTGHFDEDGGAVVAEDVGDAFDGGVGGNLRQRGAHDFADD